MAVHGLDISHWQSTTPPLGAQDFVFCRATYGTSRDGKYIQHANATRAAGAVLGAYHFGRAGSVVSVASQVLAFLGVAGNADILALDLENDAGNPDMTQAEASHFIAEVKRLRPGVPIGLYHSLSGFPQRLGQHFNWVAYWGASPPPIPWKFWQYTSSGSLPGYTGRLDMNRFNGTLAQLRAMTGSTGDDMAIRVPESTSTVYLLDVKEGTDFYADADCTKRLGEFESNKRLVYLGSPIGESTPSRAVVHTTGAPYSDGNRYPTLVYVRDSDVGDPVRIIDPTPHSDADLLTAERKGYDTARSGLQLNWPPRP